MADILRAIIETKQREVASLRSRLDLTEGKARAADQPPVADFAVALARRGGGKAAPIRVIAEIKKASPSAGVLRPDFDPPAIARSYARHGASALSVLTDESYFQGSLDHLRAVAQAVTVPLLRKDFLIDPLQVVEARLAGASAALLIAECLTPVQLADLVGLIHGLGMTALVELHDPKHLPAVLASGTKIVGVNNRDLRTFTTDLRQTTDLLDDIPRDRIVVSESGIKTRDDVRCLSDAGVDAILVGETFMRAVDPGAKLAELVGPG